MARKKRERDEAPEGGWLGPPPTTGLKPLFVGVGKHRKPVKQTPADKRLRRKWEEKMAKADAKGKWRFKWKPE